VKLTLKNNKQQTISIHVPVGTLFYLDDPGQQTLITVEQQIIILAPGEKKSQEIFAYCSEHYDRSPNTSSTFSLGRNKKALFDSLFQFTGNLKIPESDHQAMVWAISDNSPVSAIGIETLDQKKLRKYLFELTGQSISDFASGYLISIDENGYIVKKLYRITGDMEFTSEKMRYAYQEVYTPEGKLKFRSNMALEIPVGRSDYKFYIVVKDWPKGKYTLNIVDRKEILGTCEFEVI
jgi:hypothetical protein